MDIKLKLIIFFTYLYGFFEIFMSVSQRLKRKRNIIKSGDKWSIWVLGIFIAIGYSLSFNIATTKTGRIYNRDTFFVIGAISTIIGLIIRVNSMQTLKQQFTYTVTKIENHELIETGFYKYIRHPGYLGQLIIILGISIALSNWLSIVLMMIPVLFGYIYRITIEEQFMTKQMGQKYIEYQLRTKRLIPMIY